MLPATLKLDLTVDADGFEVLYRQDTGVLLWPPEMEDNLWPASMDEDFWPAGSGYQAWPGEVQAEALTYRFLVRTTGGPNQSAIPECKAVLDVVDVEEALNDVAISAGTGTRLALKKSYRAILAVQVSIQQIAGLPDARTVEVIDKSSTLGPLIKVYDASHSAVAGVVDAYIKGY
jgi:hypothetical protein